MLRVLKSPYFLNGAWFLYRFWHPCTERPPLPLLWCARHKWLLSLKVFARFKFHNPSPCDIRHFLTILHVQNGHAANLPPDNNSRFPVAPEKEYWVSTSYLESFVKSKKNLFLLLLLQVSKFPFPVTVARHQNKTIIPKIGVEDQDIATITWIGFVVNIATGLYSSMVPDKLMHLIASALVEQHFSNLEKY